MNAPDEHDDDLESEVAEGAAVETEHYQEADEDEEVVRGSDITNASDPSEGSLTHVSEETEDEGSDTI